MRKILIIGMVAVAATVCNGRRVHRGGQNDTRRWTKWYENGQFGRNRGVGMEIATFKVKTFKSDRLKQADYCKAATNSYRPQTTQDCLT